jgi:hypothetical protein
LMLVVLEVVATRQTPLAWLLTVSSS